MKNDVLNRLYAVLKPELCNNNDDTDNALDAVSDFKVAEVNHSSYELFFVKGKLETVRHAEYDEKSVTVYARHDGKMGESTFTVYPSATCDEVAQKVKRAANNALLIFDEPYELVANEIGEYEIKSNISSLSPDDVACRVSEAVERANVFKSSDVNALEVFVKKTTSRVLNSRGLDKTQTRYGISVEAIPTAGSGKKSVELFECYKMAALDEKWLERELRARLRDARARMRAVQPATKPNLPVLFNAYELNELFENLVADCNASAVYQHANLRDVGDGVQTAPQYDKINVTMRASVPNCPASRAFDGDGFALKDRQIIKDGKVCGHYGAYRYAQYLGEDATGALGCIDVASGSLTAEALKATPHLEIVYMSGLQVDLYSDYIGGEVRLAYVCEGGKRKPISGIAISGKLSAVLNTLRLSAKRAIVGGYCGPAQALADGFKIF